MNSIGIVRRLDKLGRICIPKEIRTRFSIVNDDSAVEFFVDGDSICIKKYHEECIIHDTTEDFGNKTYRLNKF